MRAHVGRVAVAVALAVIMDGSISVPGAAEFALLPPTEVEMVDNGQQHIYQIWFPNTAGGNWTSPVNYADGNIYVRQVIREIQKHCQLGLYYWWNGDRSQHGGGLIQDFDNVGDEKTTNATLKSLWHSHTVNWTNMGNEWRFQIRDGNSIQFQTVAQQRTYLPLKYNATVVLVPAGETFSGWENYPIDGQVAARSGARSASKDVGRVRVFQTAAGNVVIDIALEGNHEMRVVDGKGRIVAAAGGAGYAKHVVDGLRLPAGVYMARVSALQARLCRSFVVSR